MNRFGRIALKTILWIVGSIIGLVLLIFILIRIPAVQNFVVQQVVSFLEKKIETPVRIERVSLDLPKLLVLEGVYFEDQKQDTLFAGDLLKVDISLLKLLNNKVEINEIDLRGITAKIDRTLPDSTFNFDYIVDAFVSEDQKEPKPEDTTSTMEFSIDKINLDRIRLVYKDAVIGTNADFNLGHFDTRIKTFDLNNMHFDIPKINIKGINTAIQQWAVATAEDAPDPEDLGVEKATGAEADMPSLKLGTINFQDIKLAYADSVSAMDAQVAFKRLFVELDKLDLNGEMVDIKQVLLENSESKITFGKTAATATEATSDVEPSADTAASPINWRVNIADIDLRENRLAFFDANQPKVAKGMDYGNLDIQGFNFKLTDFFFAIDSISGNLKKLNFSDRSGFELKALTADFAYTDQGATLENFYLETPYTLFRNYVKVQYPSLESISEHPENIYLDANVKGSYFGMQDALLLMPDLAEIEAVQPLRTQRFNIQSKIVGRVDDLKITNLEFSTLNQTRLSATAHIVGLPDVDRLYADVQLKELTSGRRDLNRMIAKSMLPDSIDLPERIALSGNFKGGMNNFSTNMMLRSTIGTADLKASYQVANAGRDTSYDAHIAIADFDAGKLMMMDSTLGKISFAADVSGKGLDPAQAVADINAHLVRAEAMGYEYKDIELTANAANGDINATINSDDPNIRLNMEAFANMTGSVPSFNMMLMVDSLNTKNLKLTDNEIRFHGKFTADFETADPDSLNGYFNLTNAIIAMDNDRYALDTVSIRARSDENQNLIQLSSEFLTGHVIGSYKLTQLGSAFQDVLTAYYNPEEPAPTAASQRTQVNDTIPPYDPVDMAFSFAFQRSPLIIKMMPDLTEMQPITLDGNFNSDNQSINIKGVAPRAVYSGTEINRVSFDVNTYDSIMYYAVLINEINVSEIQISNTLLSGTLEDDRLDIGLWVRDGQGKEQYHIGSAVLLKAEEYIFSLKENGLMLNYDLWQVDPQNRLAFGSKGLLANNFRLSKDGQELRIQSDDSVYNSPIQLDFDNFRIETFTNFIESNTLVLGGAINGDAHIDRLDSSPVFESHIDINEFYFGQDTIGDINIQVDNKTENTFAANLSITGQGNDINLSGDYYAPPTGASSMDFVLALNNLNMSTIEAFSFGNLRRTAGSINGKLDITGTADAPSILGDINFNGVKMNVSMLNATFGIDQQRINFNEGGLRFNQFTLQDSVGNTARVNGNISTKNYTDFVLGLDIKSNDLQVVNSTVEDNDLFYGKVFINTDLQISGGLTSPEVNGSLSINDKTDFTYVMPQQDPGMVDREGIVEFTSLAPQDSVLLLSAQDTTNVDENAILGMNISINLNIDREASFHVIVDPGTGDALFIRGEALLSLGIDPGGEMTLAGTYEVEEGNYSLSFNMINRRFDFKQGSTITWGGDVMDADLNLTAIYRLQAQPIDLVENQIIGNANYYRQRLPFDVNLIIGGKIMEPIISFDIELGSGGNASTIPQDVTQLVESRLAALRDDESEMNKQTFALLVLGRFIAQNPFQSSGGSSTASMVRSSVSSLLTNQLNQLAGDLIAGVELNFDLQSTADDYSTGEAQNRTDLNVGLSKRLLDDRLKVTVGSNFELEGSAQPGQQTTNIAGDISLEYQLSRDGRYVARAYRTNQYQVTLQGQFIETGLGFIINMNYDEFKEIFMSARRLQRLHQNRQEELREEMYNNSNNNDSIGNVNSSETKGPSDTQNQLPNDSITNEEPEEQNSPIESFNKAINRNDTDVAEETERSPDEQ